jgi:hypothetical protein
MRDPELRVFVSRERARVLAGWGERSGSTERKAKDDYDDDDDERGA